MVGRTTPINGIPMPEGAFMLASEHILIGVRKSRFPPPLGLCNGILFLTTFNGEQIPLRTVQSPREQIVTVKKILGGRNKVDGLPWVYTHLVLRMR